MFQENPPDLYHSQHSHPLLKGGILQEQKRNCLYQFSHYHVFLTPTQQRAMQPRNINKNLDLILNYNNLICKTYFALVCLTYQSVNVIPRTAQLTLP